MITRLKKNLLNMGWYYADFGEGNGNPLQCSCLENPMDRGAWWAAVHGVTKNWTGSSDRGIMLIGYNIKFDNILDGLLCSLVQAAKKVLSLDSGEYGDWMLINLAKFAYTFWILVPLLSNEKCNLSYLPLRLIGRAKWTMFENPLCTVKLCMNLRLSKYP